MYVCARFESDICIPSYFFRTITKKITPVKRVNIGSFGTKNRRDDDRFKKQTEQFYSWIDLAENTRAHNPDNYIPL